MQRARLGDELELSGPADVLAALARVGRSEDLARSPDGHRWAIAGFGRSTVVIVHASRVDDAVVEVASLLEIRSEVFSYPHGIEFLDDEVVAVANRHGAVALLRVPSHAAGVRELEVDPMCVLGTAELVETPGSLDAVPLGGGLYDLLVANNYVHTVTRHLLDARDGWRSLSDEVLLARGLAIPDGLTRSPDGRWIAVSNHDTHAVLLYADGVALGPDAEPDGELRDVSYPHGLRFSPDGELLLVADAGGPYVHVFTAGGGDWSGTRDPDASIRVMSDDVYFTGRYNPQEGGPKGLALDAAGTMVAVSSEHQPLGFFDLRAALGEALPVTSHPRRRAGGHAARSVVLRSQRRAAEAERAVVEADERTRRAEERAGRAEELAAQAEDARAAAARGIADMAAQAEMHRARADALQTERAAHEATAADLRAQLVAVRASTSWRVTGPLRRVSGARRRLLGR